LEKKGFHFFIKFIAIEPMQVEMLQNVVWFIFIGQTGKPIAPNYYRPTGLPVGRLALEVKIFI